MRKRQTHSAFTFIEAMVVVGILCLLALLLLPYMARNRGCYGQRISCLNNQRQIALAFKQWALDQNDQFPMALSTNNGGTREWALAGMGWPTFSVMSNELNTPKVLICPDDPFTNRVQATIFQPALNYPNQTPLTNYHNISYFVGIDAVDTQPTMFLIGDSHLTLDDRGMQPGTLTVLSNSNLGWTKKIPNHKNGGQIGLVDGSVTSYSQQDLKTFLAQSGIATNRLAVP